MQEVLIGKNDSGQRLDKFLKKYMPLASAGFIYSSIRKKKIRLNGRRAQPSQILEEGDALQIFFDTGDMVREMPQGFVLKTAIEFSAVYQDENILIVDKPPGLLSHPDGGQGTTLTDQILYYLYKCKEYNPAGEKTFIPAICNRLDRNTGGLTIAAKNFNALQDMNYMIRERWVARYYKLVVAGLIEEALEVSAYLVKDRRTNKVRVLDQWMEGSDRIETCIRPLKRSPQGYTLVEVRLGTGKTHQIRAQLAHIGHPVIGDTKYGDREANHIFKRDFGLKHQFLYAYRLVFERATPLLKHLEGRSVAVPLPPELRRIRQELFG
ncbi:MAG: RluA family pseudouridine synthase [Bacillota bacterium]|nr:RluA family pseudouridine synthase [Bacillota bacterium]MDD3298452.1 RluA family pseudouridine synthase [Bacillota bacterium]MDD3850783.1 RluA family pseudouridine synthase [Bacillota bacterium]MDD4707302.1 RluA family pseudouridine synthase [Bacillota bacterium]